MSIKATPGKEISQPAVKFDTYWLENVRILARPDQNPSIIALLRPMATVDAGKGDGSTMDIFGSATIEIDIPDLVAAAATMPDGGQGIQAVKDGLFAAIQAVAQAQGKI